MTFFIDTLSGEKIAIQVLRSSNPTGQVVFLEHGLAGFKEEGMIQTAAKAFLDTGFTAVLFDARFGLGESDGPLEQANFTHFIEDIQTVTQWAETQDFYAEPFALCGHSLGAGACLHYAASYADKVSTVVSLSGVISGKLLLDSYTRHKPDFVADWQKNHLLYRERPDDKTKNGFISYAHIQEAMKYDLRTEAPYITCPVLVICGDRDISSTVEINTALFEKLGGEKTMEIIPNCGHTYQTPENKECLYQSMLKWIRAL